MSLRRKLIAYLVAIHLPFAALAVYLLGTRTVYLILVEAAFVASLVVGIALVRGLFVTVERIGDGARFISDGDFTSRFRPSGHEEMDRLIDVYNRMADHLREERTRNQEQNYFLEKILERAPLGLLTFDYDGRISSASPGAERLLQLGSNALVGLSLGEIDHPNASALTDLRTGDARIVAFTGNRRVKCERGEFMDRGFPRAFVTLAELTEELRQSEKSAYEKVIRLMSHEVNNTVAASTSILTACLRFGDRLDGDDREDYVTGLRTVVDRTDQLNAFMRGFADVVRIPEPKLAPCDVAAMIDHVFALMREEARERNVTLERSFDPDVPAVALDRIQMEQVVVNIVKNALEAIGRGGTVTARLRVVDGRPVAVFEDTGPGIGPEVSASLFTPFFTTKQNGQGIGLTVVQEILTRHGFPFSLEGPAGGPTEFKIAFDRRP